MVGFLRAELMCFEEEERGWRDMVKEKSWEGEEEGDEIGESDDDCKASCLGFCFSEKVWELFFTCCRWVSMMIEERKEKKKRKSKKGKGIFVLIKGYDMV